MQQLSEQITKLNLFLVTWNKCDSLKSLSQTDHMLDNFVSTFNSKKKTVENITHMQ